MTATMEASPKANPETAKSNAKKELIESGLDEHSAEMFLADIEDLDLLAAQTGGRREEELEEIEATVEDIALRTQGLVLDEATGEEFRIHDELTDSQKAIIQKLIFERLGDEGLDWLNDTVDETHYADSEKEVLQSMFSRDATEQLKPAGGSSEIVSDNNYATIMLEASKDEDGAYTLTEPEAVLLSYDLNKMAQAKDDTELTEKTEGLIATIKNAVMSDVSTGVLEKIMEISDKLRAEIASRTTTLDDEEAHSGVPEPSRPATPEAPKMIAEEIALVRLYDLGNAIKQAHERGDADTAEQLFKECHDRLIRAVEIFKWDANNNTKRIQVVDQIKARMGEDVFNEYYAKSQTKNTVTTTPVEAEGEPEEVEAVITQKTFRDRMQAVKGALQSLGYSDITTVAKQLKYAFTKSSEASMDKKQWSTKKKILAIGIGAVGIAGAAYLGNKYGIIDANPFDGDGLDLNPFNNKSDAGKQLVENSQVKPPVGGVETSSNIGPDIAGYSEVVQPGGETGATYTMGRMFGGQLSAEQLHDVYLTAVEQKGSRGFADLMTGNVIPLDAPVDKWGTVTQINPGEVGFTGQGRKYLEEVARAKGYIG